MGMRMSYSSSRTMVGSRGSRCANGTGSGQVHRRIGIPQRSALRTPGRGLDTLHA